MKAGGSTFRRNNETLITSGLYNPPLPDLLTNCSYPCKDSYDVCGNDCLMPLPPLLHSDLPSKGNLEKLCFIFQFPECGVKTHTQ